MTKPFRASKFIRFNTGKVKIAPARLQQRLKTPWADDDKIRLFECRVEVWTLGVAVAMLKQIEAADNPCIWSHAAYGLVAVIFSYFEMVGKTLNPDSQSSGTASPDFRSGFSDVYPRLASEADEFWNRIRNGIYHLGYTKHGLLLHDERPRVAFDTKVVRDPTTQQPTTVYRMNPHQATRDVVEHFPGFVQRINTTAGLRKKFLVFFDTFFLTGPRSAPRITITEGITRTVKYEISMFEFLREQLTVLPQTKTGTGSDPDEDALLESFLLHTRILRDFFYNDPAKRGNDDVLACDFIPGWKESKNGYIESLRRPINKLLAHLTVSREEYKIRKYQWDHERIHEALSPVIERFRGLLANSRHGLTMLDMPTTRQPSRS